MTLSAATDGDISDKELNIINFLFTTLPIFENINNDYLSKKMIECMELTEIENNFENILDLINSGLSSNKDLKKTAYILALEISAIKHTIRSKYAELKN